MATASPPAPPPSTPLTAAISEYGATVPDPHGHGGLPNRQSSGTSEALQYYWSSSAGGQRSGSISSQLGMSPIEPSTSSQLLGSPYSLSPHPPPVSPETMFKHSSSVSLHDLVAQEAEQERLRVAGAFSDAPEDDRTHHHAVPRVRVEGEASQAGPSNRHIHLVSYSSDGSMDRLASLATADNDDALRSSSPTSNSGESEYSLPDENADVHRRSLVATGHPPNELLPRELHPKPRQPSARSSERPRGLVDTDGKLDVLLDPSFEEWAHQRVWADEGRQSPLAPVTGPAAAVGSDSPLSPQAPEQWHTPTSSIFERRQHMSPSWSARTPSPGKLHEDLTPRNSTQTLRGSGSKLPGARGRMLFVAPPDMSRQSLDDLEREGNESSSSSRYTGSRVLSVAGQDGDDLEAPRSAPPHQTSFQDIGMPVEDRRRPTSLLPSVQMVSPNLPRSSRLSAPSDHPEDLERRSPEPPPRSERRKLYSPTSPDKFVESPMAATPGEETPPRVPAAAAASTPSSSTPPSSIPHQPVAMRTQTLPTIINTPHTPIASPQGQQRSPPRSSTAPLSVNPDPTSRPSSPRPNMTQSGTLQDLSDLLSGAIDDIGLIDSRETPPPTVGEPSKQRVLSQLPTRTASAGATAAATQTITQEQQQQQSLSPTSANFGAIQTPSAGSSIMNSVSPVGLGIMGAVGTTVAAVGSAATQRTSGNVARHVRKASSILSLRSTNYTTSPTVPTFSSTSKLPTAIVYTGIKQLKSPGDRARAYAKQTAGLGQSESGLAEWLYNMQHVSRQVSRPEKQQAMAQLGLRAPEEPSARNVSTGSEFPMRADAYSATPISVRHMEPADAPTALPSNLPYPQLQGVKGSGSMQSLASISSVPKPRAGFRNMMGKLRRDKENTGLGPPTGALTSLNPNAMNSKRDVRDFRNVPISGPRMETSPSGRNSFDSIDRVNPSLSVPRGPREAPGTRASFDAPRGSTDSGRPANPSLHPSPLRGAYDGVDEYDVSDDDVRNLSELLPQSERSVVRQYLAQYGDPNYAMSAYIEDKKKGQLLQA